MKFIASIFLFLLLTVYSIGQSTEVINDQFEDNRNEWLLGENKDFTAAIHDGVFSLKHLDTDGMWYLINEYDQLSSKDWHIETSIQAIEGMSGAGFNLIFGASDVNFYLFGCSLQGHWAILNYNLETQEVTPIVPWTKNLNVVKGLGQSNKLRIDCIQGSVKFYVNDIALHQMSKPENFGNHFGYLLIKQIAIDIDDFTLSLENHPINLVKGAETNKTVENLGAGVNSIYSELGPLISPDGKTLYFFRKEYPGNTGPANEDDAWYSTFSEGSWSPAKNIGSPINNEGPNFISSVLPDGNQLFLNNRYDKIGQVLSEGYSISYRTKNGWSRPQNIEIDNFYNQHEKISGAMSPSGKVIVMALWREDTQGESDLYVSFRKENGGFTSPKNMGMKLNTPGIEMSPFIAADNKTLYFATNGHVGYGKKDIFISRRLDETWLNWSKPQNLGPTINTPKWEAYFSVPAKGDYGYMVSSRNSIGKSDIYRIQLPEGAQPYPVALISGIVKNGNTNEPIGTEVVITNLSTNEKIAVARSHPLTGQYEISLPVGGQYAFYAESDGLFSLRQHLDLSQITKYTEMNRDLSLLKLEKGVRITLNNVFFVRSESTILPSSKPELNKLVQTLEQHPQIKIRVEGHTDNQGSKNLNLSLSSERAKAIQVFLIEAGIDKSRVKTKGFGGSRPVSPNDNETNRSKNRRVEFVIIE